MSTQTCFWKCFSAISAGKSLWKRYNTPPERLSSKGTRYGESARSHACCRFHTISKRPPTARTTLLEAQPHRASSNRAQLSRGGKLIISLPEPCLARVGGVALAPEQLRVLIRRGCHALQARVARLLVLKRALKARRRLLQCAAQP